MSGRLFPAMRERWQRAAQRFEAYALLEPASPSFICQAQDCAAHCCKIYSVSLGEREVARMQATTGWQPVQFLESENGEPIELPLAQPYLLRREGNGCALLGHDLLCGVYEGRPDACRLYPHFVLFLREDGRPVQPPGEVMAAAVAAAVAGEPHEPAAVLVRHVECPGFTGPPLGEEHWGDLFRETARLQYGGSLAGGWPGA